VGAISVISIMVVGLERPGRESAVSSLDSPSALGIARQGASPVAALWVSDGFGGVTSSPGGTAKAPTYPQMVCRSLAWTCTVDAEAGSGYVAGTSGTGQKTVVRPLQTRLPAHRAATTAAIVVVDAGRFDTAVAGPQFESAASRYVAALRTAYPKARIALVVPSSPDASRPEFRRIGGVLREVAATQGAVVVDPSGAGALADTRRNKTLVTSGGDLNAAGQTYYAQVLVRLLMSTGVVDGAVGQPRPSASREA
jgi:hypothetical protein